MFGKEGYNETVDWWSLGTILFEMLVGYPPFFAENPSATCKKVMDWKNTFFIPKEADLSPEATDLLRRLIRDPSERLGIHGVQEIKAHPFFAGISWKNIRETRAINIPNVSTLQAKIDPDSLKILLIPPTSTTLRRKSPGFFQMLRNLRKKPKTEKIVLT